VRPFYSLFYSHADPRRVVSTSGLYIRGMPVNETPQEKSDRLAYEIKRTKSQADQHKKDAVEAQKSRDMEDIYASFVHNQKAVDKLSQADKLTQEKDAHD
jgi:hypothetical protein